MFRVVTKLRRLKLVLKEINKDSFGEIQAAKVESRSKMVEL